MFESIPQPVTLQVNGLGNLIGWEHDDGTQQFFGIPYATIEARFKASQLLERWQDDTFDARHLGKYCPQPFRHYPFPMPERAYAGPSEPDEFACCNLNIVVPPATTLDGCLPTLVYLHGGAYTYGSANYSIVDGRPLAMLSSELGMPTMIVNISYRVGIFGFMASQDIKQDNGTGINGNWGLLDQRNALQWLHNHLPSFGGDPSKITIFGQSAGGSSADIFLQSESQRHLCRSAILMSGTLPVCGVFSETDYEVLYERLLGLCKIDSSKASRERLADLRQVSAEDLVAQTNALQGGIAVPQFGPCDDGHLLGEGKRVPRLEDYRSLKHDNECRVMIGDCINEAIIYSNEYTASALPTAEVVRLVHAHLPGLLAQDLLKAYNITPGMTEAARFAAVEALVSHVSFLAPAYYLAENNNADNTFVYRWDHASQWDNDWGRGKYAHHSMDYMYVFGCMTDILSEDERKLGRAIGTDFIIFANGGSPYPSYGTARRARRYGPRSAVTIDEQNSCRPAEWLDWMRPHLKALEALAFEFSMRRSAILRPHAPTRIGEAVPAKASVPSQNGHASLETVM